MALRKDILLGPEVQHENRVERVVRDCVCHGGVERWPNSRKFQVSVGQWWTGVCGYMEGYMVNRLDRFLKARTVRGKQVQRVD